MGGFAGLDSYFNPNNPFVYNVGGGANDAERLLSMFQAVEAARAARKSTGLGLLDTLINVQQDPFSIVPALMAYKSAGGGVQAPVSAFGATGGAGTPSPYGGLVDRLLGDLSTFAMSQQQAQAAAPSTSGGLIGQAAQTVNYGSAQPEAKSSSPLPSSTPTPDLSWLPSGYSLPTAKPTSFSTLRGLPKIGNRIRNAGRITTPLLTGGKTK